MVNKLGEECGRTSTIILKHDATNALGIASFIFGLISIFVLAPIFVPLALVFGTIAVVKKQLAWGISGLICAVVGFITSPILMAFFGLATLGSLEGAMKSSSQGSMESLRVTDLESQSGNSKAGIDWLNFFIDMPIEYKLVVVIIGAVVLLVIIFLFRSELGHLISQMGGRIREIRFGKLAVTFGEELKEVLEERKRNPGLKLASPDLPQERLKSVDTAASGLVMESWGRLNQAVREVAEIRMVQPGILGGVGEAAGILVGLGILSVDYTQQIRLLYNLGKKVSDSKGKLSMQDAYMYKELVDTLVEAVRRNVIPPAPPRPEPPQRRTQVGGYFSPPSSGRPSAILVGVTGQVQGRQFQIDKDLFRIGANPENDLVIVGDEFVSGNHALLHYDKGALFISDQKSRNGTFLNETRLKEMVMTLNPKDRVRVGNCTFEIVPGPGH
jgi:hypothetical protein